MSSDLDTFLRVVEQWPVGSEVTVESLRADLEATQLKPSSYGPLFRAACVRGVLAATSTATRCRPASRRGGRALVYTRTTPEGATA